MGNARVRSVDAVWREDVCLTSTCFVRLEDGGAATGPEETVSCLNLLCNGFVGGGISIFEVPGVGLSFKIVPLHGNLSGL